MTALCLKCGRPLKDPKSIAAGMGKICLRKSVVNNRFSPFRAKYTYELTDQVMTIIDLNGQKSLTNDIEYVIADIEKERNIDATLLKIMYKDSEGIWDGINYYYDYYGDKKFNFFPIRETEYSVALSKLLTNER